MNNIVQKNHKTLKQQLMSTTVASLLLISGIVTADPISITASEYELEHRRSNKPLILNLIGSGPMYEDEVPDIDGDGAEDPAMCFDVDLVNKKNNRVVGTATDCLSNVTPSSSGLKLVGTTYFNFFRHGTLITRGNTTVQPALADIVTPSGQPITHITGGSSEGNSVIGGTGRFDGATGTARLSGMVNMSEFVGNVGDPIAFDCLFVVELDFIKAKVNLTL